MITDIIKTLQSGNFYNSGEYVEIAKGKNELTTNFKGLKNKIVRLWQLKE